MSASIVSPPMRRKAEQLAAQLTTFSRGRSKQTGQTFYIVPASNRLAAHWTAVDGSGCTCIGFQRRGTCTHAIAARTVHERRQPPAPTPAPAPKARYEDLFPACAGGCGDVVERKGERCYRCAGDEAHRLDLEARMRARSHARVTEAWL